MHDQKSLHCLANSATVAKNRSDTGWRVAGVSTYSKPLSENGLAYNVTVKQITSAKIAGLGAQ